MDLAQSITKTQNTMPAKPRLPYRTTFDLAMDQRWSRQRHQRDLDMDTQHVICGFNLDPTFGLRR
jgi:hypothetical protein